MGYLITAHVFRERPNFSRLAELPKSIGYRAYLHDEDLLTDMSSLGSALPDAEILPRETPWNTQLHAIATEELQAFAGIKEAILGLGSFDPPEDESEWRLVASR